MTEIPSKSNHPTCSGLMDANFSPEKASSMGSCRLSMTTLFPATLNLRELFKYGVGTGLQPILFLETRHDHIGLDQDLWLLLSKRSRTSPRIASSAPARKSLVGLAMENNVGVLGIGIITYEVPRGIRRAFSASIRTSLGMHTRPAYLSSQPP